ncbi:hypothetical protein H7849_03615 [Alloacidobacterium dinghuense]|uniref:Uncharacterized protein n=1 Tax=Alloacidobacterium dinghuense TaxID=2763107 RepID=A0A7G8BKK7_9BACT|nr:hypothetical protein [Alloacidobacterium dinghuense]QNI33077.1 hypothetical protein H7849_03615 [Alloacidobacterium dinghuense]
MVDTKFSMHDSFVWREKVTTAPDEELLAFREADYLGLRDVECEHWRVPIVDDEIRRRRLNVGS